MYTTLGRDGTSHMTNRSTGNMNHCVTHSVWSMFHCPGMIRQLKNKTVWRHKRFELFSLPLSLPFLRLPRKLGFCRYCNPPKMFHNESGKMRQMGRRSCERGRVWSLGNYPFRRLVWGQSFHVLSSAALSTVQTERKKTKHLSLQRHLYQLLPQWLCG